MKFRKKPVVIEAVETVAVLQTMQGKQPMSSMPGWVCDAIDAGVLDNRDNAMVTALYVKTLEGDMLAEYHDWIIKGVQGELYPCKPDIFAATYDEVPA